MLHLQLPVTCRRLERAPRNAAPLAGPRARRRWTAGGKAAGIRIGAGQSDLTYGIVQKLIEKVRHRLTGCSAWLAHSTRQPTHLSACPPNLASPPGSTPPCSRRRALCSPASCPRPAWTCTLPGGQAGGGLAAQARWSTARAGHMCLCEGGAAGHLPLPPLHRTHAAPLPVRRADEDAIGASARNIRSFIAAGGGVILAAKASAAAAGRRQRAGAPRADAPASAHACLCTARCGVAHRLPRPPLAPPAAGALVVGPPPPAGVPRQPCDAAAGRAGHGVVRGPGQPAAGRLARLRWASLALRHGSAKQPSAALQCTGMDPWLHARCRVRATPAHLCPNTPPRLLPAGASTASA